ncbi:chromate efflux transporter [Hwanghaeella sp.]|uniref:chromate efflux transporter n=1 Tax=Hwanghaeella sp. TaxID=2605943 RepID=UPI003CCB8FDA
MPQRVAASGVFEILAIFLRLGLTSFGGPVAHLGYFRTEFVERRKWLTDSHYGELVALCQFLPGPASSQVGLALGLMRGGYLGALAAWIGFTLPSAAIMIAVAYGLGGIEHPLVGGLVHGLKLVAVAIVAQAVIGMARNLCPDRATATIAFAALVFMSLMGGALAQIAVIVAGAGLGFVLLRREAPDASAEVDPGFVVSGTVGGVAGALFLAFLIGLPLAVAVWPSELLSLIEAFYRGGALVFGGGHVILPLLENAVVGRGWMDSDTFLSGYGAAQAVPGPLFTLSAYLGAAGDQTPNGLLGGAIALAAIFLPSIFLVPAGLSMWARIRKAAAARSGIAGVNAAVVGLLGAALYDPIFVSIVHQPHDFALAAGGLALLQVGKVHPILVVVLGAVAGILLTLN